MINIDFSSVPSREALPEGIYSLQVAAVEETISTTGNPMLKVTFDVLNVEGGRKLWDNFVLIERSLWKLKEFFDAMGIDTSEIVEMDVQEIVGYEVQARVTQEEYQGTIQNRIKKILPA